MGCPAPARQRMWLGNGKWAHFGSFKTVIIHFTRVPNHTVKSPSLHTIYMDLREGDLAERLNIWSSCGSALYNLIYQTVLPGGLLQFTDCDNCTLWISLFLTTLQIKAKQVPPLHLDHLHLVPEHFLGGGLTVGQLFPYLCYNECGTRLHCKAADEIEQPWQSG